MINWIVKFNTRLIFPEPKTLQSVMMEHTTVYFIIQLQTIDIGVRFSRQDIASREQDI